MISPAEFYNLLTENEIDFFTGVPDSLLKDFSAYLLDHDTKNHVIASNEGAAIAIAAGYHLATGKIAAVYLQNSGLGNTINPLISLVDPEVYSIPVFLIIGWRGEPGKKDEPQHQKQGKTTIPILETIGIKYGIMPENPPEIIQMILDAKKYIHQSQAPFALIVRAGSFEKYSAKFSPPKNNFSLSREDAIKIIIDQLTDQDVIVSTTGKASRELFEYREQTQSGHQRDFLTVGCMGHSSQIALGIALKTPQRKVFCLDGDGAAIMHLGSLAIIGQVAPSNFVHIVLNNAAHESVGGQPTAATVIDFCGIATACHYRLVMSADGSAEITESLGKIQSSPGPAFLEIKVNLQSRSDLGRPTTAPIENKISFMNFLKK